VLAPLRPTNHTLASFWAAANRPASFFYMDILTITNFIENTRQDSA
jgi:hypothetical protein